MTPVTTVGPADLGVVDAGDLSISRLANGLRVVCCDVAGAGSVAVSVHYGVGHRDERPGEEGLAHLFEHLMTQDRHGAVTAAKLLRAQALGGTAGATTHQDYTDFYQQVPAEALEAVLHWEADRMRAPRFSEAHLHAQVRGVAAEIAAAVRGRPYGGVPWPRLPAVLFSAFPNRHDGYGDIERLSTLSVEECERFFTRHYAPGNAVLTVVGDLTARREPVASLVDRHLGRLVARPVAPRVRRQEPALVGEEVTAVEVAGSGRPIAAIGYRLPDPFSDLDGYLAHMVLADLLVESDGARTDGPRVISAACGFFGPLDAADPDVLVVVAGPAHPGAPDPVLGALDRRLAHLAGGRADAEEIGRAVSRVALEHDRRSAQPLERCRDLGRFALLFDRPGGALDLGNRVRGIGPEAVRVAAAALASAGRRVLVAIPAGTSADHPAGALVASAAGPPPRREGADFEPLAIPHLRGQARWVGLAERRLDGGHGLTVISHPAARAAEVRVRLRLGSSLPEVAAAAARVGVRALEDAVPLAPVASSRAGSVEVSLAVPPERVGVVARRLAALLRTGIRSDAAVPPPRSAADVADRLSQRPHRDAVGATHHTPILLTPRVDIVVVTAHDSGRLADVLTEDLEPLPPGEVARATIPRPGSGGLLCVPAPGGQAAAVLRAPQPVEVGDAACYLLVAVLSGVGGVAEAGRARLGTMSGSGLYVGRDVVAGRTQFFLRGTWTAHGVAPALRRLHGEVVAPRNPDPTRGEVDAARRFCVGQWLGAFDDPARLADTVAQQLGYGQNPAALPSFADALDRVTPDDLAAAWGALREEGFAGVVAGAVGSLRDTACPWRLMFPPADGR